MFENIPNQPEDIFAKTDEAAPQVAPPTAPSTVDASSVQPQPLTLPQSSPERPPGDGGRLKIIIIIVAVLAIVVGAFLISWRILSSRTQVVPKVEEVQEAEEDGEVIKVEEAEEVQEAEIDTDKDGLIDSQEAELGTNQEGADTDGDLLFDLEEIEVYGTNPLNSDTDNDGYMDGNEVKAGYDPNGPGKLIEIPSGS